MPGGIGPRESLAAGQMPAGRRAPSVVPSAMRISGESNSSLSPLRLAETIGP
jgi:hypothetical protein